MTHMGTQHSINNAHTLLQTAQSADLRYVSWCNETYDTITPVMSNCQQTTELLWITHVALPMDTVTYGTFTSHRRQTSHTRRAVDPVNN